MKAKIIGLLKRWRGLLVRQGIVFLCAIALGLGFAAYNKDSYLPTLDGNVYAMLPYEHELFMVLSKERNNSLVHVDNNGRLLNYAVTDRDQAFEALEVLDNTVYAILDHYDSGVITQELVSLSLLKASMRTNSLLRLSEIGGEDTSDIIWSDVYLPPEGEASPALRLTGIDSRGRGYLMYWNMETGHTKLLSVLEEERLYALKYVADGHYVWIDMAGRAGQYIHGIWQRDVFKGKMKTPHHISTYQNYVFVADSMTGDIYELFPDGSAQLHRSGGDRIGNSLFEYRKLEIFTTYPDEWGEIQIIGLCANGSGSVVIGEDRSMNELDGGLLNLQVILLRGWKEARKLWVFFALAAEALYAILCSRRLLVRIALCEVVVGVLLLVSVTFVQYVHFKQTILSNAKQTLQLVGGNLALTLSDRAQMDETELSASVEALRHLAAVSRENGQREYPVSVIWDTPEGPFIAYDTRDPKGYLVEDVKSRGYFDIVTGILAGEDGAFALEYVCNDSYADYLYVRRFSQMGRVGCVTVSQEEAAITAEYGTFLERMLSILVACPLLFALLIYITWRLLRPLGTIRGALEEFYDCNGGNQMALDGMPKTELYEVGRVFNQLSLQTRVQLNKLGSINDSYVRLVPNCLLELLGKRDVLSLSAGECVSMDGALVMFIPGQAVLDAASLETMVKPAAEQIQAHQGMITNYDEALGALIAIFAHEEQAQECARQSLAAFDSMESRVMTAVFTERVEFGVFGSEQLIIPLAVSEKLRRRREALARLNGFGAVLVHSGAAEGKNLRLLGRDDGLPYYEDTTCRPAHWQAQWRDAAAVWAEGMEYFQAADFTAAMRRFARVLRTVPGDGAARWYLYRCESLRDRPETAGETDTGLLFDWGGEHG